MIKKFKNGKLTSISTEEMEKAQKYFNKMRSSRKNKLNYESKIEELELAIKELQEQLNNKEKSNEA